MSLQPAEGLTRVMRAHQHSVRLFLRDFEELNLLVKGQESSDRFIAWATLDFISDFNQTPPFTGLTLEDIYARGWSNLAVRGTVITLLQGLMIFYGRNHLPFSDGGISVNMNDKSGLIMSMLQFFQSMYEQNKKSIKVTLNIESLLSPSSIGLHSEYLLLAQSYGF